MIIVFVPVCKADLLGKFIWHGYVNYPIITSILQAPWRF